MLLHHLYRTDNPARVIALGNFDGVHAGHAAVLRAAVARAKALGASPCVLTFAPNPREFFFPATKPLNLMSAREKIDAIRATGVEGVTIARFNTAFSELSAEAFAKEVLVKHLGAVHVVTGENFVFGHKRGGNTQLLETWLHDVGVGYTAVAAIKDAEGITSSTRIREALVHGELSLAEHVLGRPYTISGRVIHGDKRGRTIGFPTLNLSLARRFHPLFGVYGVRITTPQGVHQGIANIGIKPSFGGTAPLLEAHSFTPLPELYGKRISVALEKFLRPEQQFASVDALIAQIKTDIQCLNPQ